MTLLGWVRQVREHELDEEKAEADVNNSNALAGELGERKRALEQWSVAAYGEVRDLHPNIQSLRAALEAFGNHSMLVVMARGSILRLGLEDKLTVTPLYPEAGANPITYRAQRKP